MSDLNIILAIVALVLISAFFSGTETGIYRLSKFRLRLGLQRQRRRYAILENIMADTRGLIFSTLIGNNIANYMATSLLTWYLLRSNYSGIEAELYAVLIMTPTLFVIGDLLPKNLFYYLADTLMPRIAPLIYIVYKLLTWCGAIAALKFFSNCFAFIVHAPPPETATQRQLIRQIVHDTSEEGILSAVQVDIIERLINIPSIQLSSVMVGLASVRMVPLTSDLAALREVLASTHFRYLPVYRSSTTDIIGLIDMYEVLNNHESFTTVEPFVKPITRIDPETRIIDALNRMRNEHLEMILVCRFDRAGNSFPIGIATMKDLVEELIGELAQW